MWPAMYRSIYGRFLLLQLDSASIVAVLSVLLSILSVASRLCSRKARRLPKSAAQLSKTTICPSASFHIFRKAVPACYTASMQLK